MAVRRILTIDNAADLAVLKQVSRPVEGPVTDELRALMDDMLETMYAAPGIGLAAVQVGDVRRVIVMDLGDREAAGEAPDEDASDEAVAAWEKARRNPRYFVNPEILWASDELFQYEEGCLSVPDVYDAVERPARVRIRYMDYAGKTIEEECDGLYAVCVQHEMDHLEGVLFIDHLSRLKRERAVARVKKAARLAA
ncbi:MAG: peptide deformylase [Brevundimonas sp.]|uniref:peptide deformylase n=1 Tax=Brevundimonas sp. TaxID=1871086 RepID=UPI002633BC8C|nr:peptide deformylase [Brevundimonas sp.]MDI6624209.1 peptide deformylase [Brevundimonas sp.]MDQ7812025.1 peptide deformylase [Brevundimonas sp.]